VLKNGIKKKTGNDSSKYIGEINARNGNRHGRGMLIYPNS